MSVSAPEHLTAEHDVSAFDSGTPELDNWLKRRALANEALGTSRTYVVTEGGRVIAFYALANGAVAARTLKSLAFARCCFMQCRTTRSASGHVPDFTSVRSIQ